MNKRTIRLLPLVLVILSGVAFWQWPRPTISDVVELYGGAASFAILSKPDSVVAYRLSPIPLGSNAQTLDDFPSSKGPISVHNEIAGKLSVALSDPRSYRWNMVKECIPTYGVRLTFEADGGAVDVLLCFECDILAIFIDGTVIGWEDFDDMRAVLVRAVQQIFPDDVELRALTE